jgi:hypothetical protein
MRRKGGQAKPAAGVVVADVTDDKYRRKDPGELFHAMGFTDKKGDKAEVRATGPRIGSN